MMSSAELAALFLKNRVRPITNINENATEECEAAAGSRYEFYELYYTVIEHSTQRYEASTFRV
jgi:hypothetical protein